MATLPAPTRVGKYADIYRGEDSGRAIGAELHAMRLNGQEVIRKERVRWQYNRSIYRGEQYVRPSNSSSTLRTYAPSYRLPSGRRRDSVNRCRRFVDGRASTLTMSQPNFQVPPETNTSAGYQAAEISTRIVQFYWSKLDLATKFRHMIRMGDIDGVAFLCVYYDHTEGDPISLPFSQDGRPIANPEMLLAMEAEGLVEWKEDNTGDVCVRNVPIGRLSVDPLARENFSQARWIIESRVRPRADIEREAGKPLKAFIEESSRMLGVRPGKGQYPNEPTASSRIAVDEFDDDATLLSARDYLLVHEAFIKPTGKYGDWPDGAHVMWLDLAPGDPVFVRSWKYPLPYVCYVPQPDHGHFLKSRAVMDDLSPIQIALNRAVSQYHELLDLYARLPIMAQRGALVSKFLYNEKRIVEYNPGFQQPNWMAAPPEPQKLLENIQFLLEQMAEIAVQNDVTRGTPPGHGIEAGVGLNLLAQQNEQQMEGLAAAARRAMEDTCSMILDVVRDFFNIQRTIAIPGVNGVEEIQNFVGSMLRGAGRVRVTGSLLPRNQAAQQQTLITLATGGLIDIRPFIPQLTEGRVDEIMTDMERHEREQRREDMEMDLLASIPEVDELWEAFQQMRGEHAMMMQEYRQAQADAEATVDDMIADPETMTVPGLPESFVPQPAPSLPPPPPAPTLADLGIQIPIPQEWNDDALHSAELDRARCADGFMARHPLVRQAYHEHNQMHVARMAERLDSLRVQPGGPMAPPDMAQDPAAPPGGGQSGGGEPSIASAPASPTPANEASGAPSSMPAFNLTFGPDSININGSPPEPEEEPVPQEPPIVNVAPAQVNVEPPQVIVQAPPAPNVVVEAAPAPNITIEAAPAPNVTIDQRRGPIVVKVERDSRGLISSLTMDETDEDDS